MTEEILFSLQDVCFSYGRTRVIHDISLSFAPGRFYGIVGPNGSGKTTLLDLLIGSKRPEQGSVLYKGREISGLSRKYLARQLALVPQEFDTGFGFSVEEIVLMGRHPHMKRFSSPGDSDWEIIDAALASIGIEDLRDRLTNTLSGGQKQRAVVARALAQDTPVLLFDEATASLDVQYTLQIFNLARTLVKDRNKTVIAVIHDLNLAAAYCDHLIFLKNGTVAIHGPTGETMTNGNIFNIFGVRAWVGKNDFNQSYQVSFQYWNDEK
jgi:iron complex transport system ATP-binding protein